MELLELLESLELLELMELLDLLEKGDSLTDWLTDNLKSRDASASKKEEESLDVFCVTEDQLYVLQSPPIKLNGYGFR